jgi:Fe-Mn family superoxide dismutase
MIIVSHFFNIYPENIHLAKAVLKPLPFPIDGLEPVISKKLMEVHYGKHHTAYATNLNNLLD